MTTEKQMTVDECIEVAEKNLDGKGVRTVSAKPVQPDRPLTAAEVVARKLRE